MSWVLFPCCCWQAGGVALGFRFRRRLLRAGVRLAGDALFRWIARAVRGGQTGVMGRFDCAARGQHRGRAVLLRAGVLARSYGAARHDRYLTACSGSWFPIGRRRQRNLLGGLCFAAARLRNGERCGILQRRRIRSKQFGRLRRQNQGRTVLVRNSNLIHSSIRSRCGSAVRRRDRALAVRLRSFLIDVRRQQVRLGAVRASASATGHRNRRSDGLLHCWR
ncbi:hypothetical protein AL346_10790 [Chelatococcus sp. CO-6]|nr:hypothetical protein AL346_10790 [Chelatococcus sp. CO-6]